MKLCSRLFVLHCRSRPKYDNCRHFDSHFEEVRGGVEPWWMARWKARAEFLLSVITVARDRDSDSERLLYFGRVIYLFFSVHQIFAVPGPIFTKLYHTTRYVLK